MKKITQEAGQAFYNGYNFRKDNTEVIVGGDVDRHGDFGTAELYLHNNLIAKMKRYTHDGNRILQITTAGWNTTTTKERLNGIDGVNIVTRNWQMYLNGEEWDGDWITI